MKSNQEPIESGARVFTRTAEVSVWWVLKLVTGLGLIPVAVGIIDLIVGSNPDLSLGVITAGVMISLAAPVAAAVLYLKPEVVFDDL